MQQSISLQKISNLLDTQKKNLLFNTIIKFQFSYCPFVWRFCLGRSNSLLNYVNERALRVVNDDHSSSYSELIMAKNELAIHQLSMKILRIKCISSKTILTFNLSHFESVKTWDCDNRTFITNQGRSKLFCVEGGRRGGLNKNVGYHSWPTWKNSKITLT